MSHFAAWPSFLLTVDVNEGVVDTQYLIEAGILGNAGMSFASNDVDHGGREDVFCISQGIGQNDTPQHVELGGIMSLYRVMAAVMNARGRFVDIDLIISVYEKLNGKETGRLQMMDKRDRYRFYFPQHILGDVGGANLVIEQIEVLIKYHFDRRIKSGLAILINRNDGRDLFFYTDLFFQHAVCVEARGPGGQVFDHLRAASVVASFGEFLDSRQQLRPLIDLRFRLKDGKGCGGYLMFEVKVLLVYFILDDSQYGRFRIHFYAFAFQLFQCFYIDVLNLNCYCIQSFTKLIHGVKIAYASFGEMATKMCCGTLLFVL